MTQTTFLIRASSTIVAKADEALAIKYLKSIGVLVKEADRLSNTTGAIEFSLNPTAAEAAIPAITKRLGRPTDDSNSGWGSYRWYVDKARTRSVQLVIDKEDGEGFLTLADSEEWKLERKVQKLNDAQKLKPLKAIDRKFKPEELQLFAAIFTVTNLGIGSFKVKEDKLVVDGVNNGRSYRLDGNLSSVATGVIHSLMNHVAGDMSEEDIDAEYRGWLKDLKKDTLHSLAKVHTDMIDLCMYLASH